MESVPLVVTTAHRGVFFGYGPQKATDKQVIRLTKARMCIYWSLKREILAEIPNFCK